MDGPRGLRIMTPRFDIPLAHPLGPHQHIEPQKVLSAACPRTQSSNDLARPFVEPFLLTRSSSSMQLHSGSTWLTGVDQWFVFGARQTHTCWYGKSVHFSLTHRGVQEGKFSHFTLPQTFITLSSLTFHTISFTSTPFTATTRTPKPLQHLSAWIDQMP